MSANVPGYDHTTPLAEAARAGHLEMVKWLMSDSRINESLEEKVLSPLSAAVSYNRLEVVRLSLKAVQWLINYGDYNDNTALHISALVTRPTPRADSVEILRLLLMHGADPELKKKNQQGASALGFVEMMWRTTSWVELLDLDGTAGNGWRAYLGWL
ncbi:hypothetical protein QBC38DRAFT_486302 [Podospora fimiseda]|uniref:Ankyrin n=1 Tax=Podospora fimiseda TaxID=252190 RepID=A0AAN7GT90_9PEZI|nr:hypothetical protein QBC38DRAFT_486302 [Podospora fimiseda]